jgi:glucose/arabinose dehydrogenase
MGVWIVRVIKTIIMLIAVMTIAIVVLFAVGPVSNFWVMLNGVLGLGVESPSEIAVEQRLTVPEGFSIGQYAIGLKKIRFMAFTQAGDLLVSQPREGKVLLLKRDDNGDGRHDGIVVLLDGLTRPHGLDFDREYLYVAESNAVGRVPFDHDKGALSGVYQVIIQDLPDGGNHWTKSIRIKDDQLYLSIGSTCNVCEEEDDRRATIMRFDLDGSRAKVFASGLRNSVGLDFAPWDGGFYATDNGRDLLGDDYPVCELNHIVEDGFYGWPYINGFGDLDPDLGEGQGELLAQARSPVFGFRAHNAPLGMRFIRKAVMPAGYERSALVALHGSWNRREPDGYKVVSLHWQEDGNITARDFMSGFNVNGNIIGRPVDVAEGPDGCVYVSDDYSGTIYRACYGVVQNKLTDASAVTQDDSYWHSLSVAEQQALERQGAVLYKDQGCSDCHLLNGDGNQNGKPLLNLAQRYSHQSLADYLLAPNPPMPPFLLSERQRLSLAAYSLK